jgi:hypothetical protein
VPVGYPQRPMNLSQSSPGAASSVLVPGVPGLDRDAEGVTIRIEVDADMVLGLAASQ